VAARIKALPILAIWQAVRIRSMAERIGCSRGSAVWRESARPIWRKRHLAWQSGLFPCFLGNRWL